MLDTVDFMLKTTSNEGKIIRTGIFQSADIKTANNEGRPDFQSINVGYCTSVVTLHNYFENEMHKSKW